MTQQSVRAAYRHEDLRAMAGALLERAGMMPEAAQVVACTLVEGDLLGHDTHGLALLPSYLKELETGSMTARGEYRVMSAKPAAQMWDGMRLPGPWLIERGLDVLIPAARELGVASLAIRRSHHIACLAVFLMRAAREGMMMILASSDAASASVAPFGGTQAVFTPNPIAIGFPCSRGDVLIDISASITTNGMCNRKAAAGETFDENWLLDADGNPTNDPQVFRQTPPGTILPVGGLSHGHKGFGLALMIEAMTAGLAGRGRADPKEGWGATVHITLYDPDAFGGKAEFLRQMDFVAEACVNNKPRQGVDAVRLPGQKGLALRARQMEQGLVLHPLIAPALAPYCETLGVQFASTV